MVNDLSRRAEPFLLVVPDIGFTLLAAATTLLVVGIGKIFLLRKA